MIFDLLALTADQNTLLIGLAIPILGVLSPLLMARQLNKFSIEKEEREIERQEAVRDEARRQQDEVAEEARKRQQEVADQVTETARVTQERQDQTDLALGRVARIAAEARKEHTKQLSDIKVVADQTHVLVNSNWITEMKKSIVSLRAQLVFAKRLIAMTSQAGQPTDEDDAKAITALEEEITITEAALAQLIKDTNTANAIAVAAAKEGPQNVVVVNPEPVKVTQTAEDEKVE